MLRMYDDRAMGGSDGIYPRTLQGAVRVINMPLELTNASEGCSVHYLDYRVSLDPKSGLLVSKVYDKRDDNPLFLDQRSSPIVPQLCPINARQASCTRSFIASIVARRPCVLSWREPRPTFF